MNTPAAGFRLNAAPRLQARLEHGGEILERALPEPFIVSDAGFDHIHSDSARDIVVFADGETYLFEEPDYEAHHEEAAGSGAVASPMPGKIVAVHVAEGAQVAKGAPLLTLEAMKMEHVLIAPFDGQVADLAAVAGAQVSEGVTLVRLEATAS